MAWSEIIAPGWAAAVYDLPVARAIPGFPSRQGLDRIMIPHGLNRITIARD